MHNHFLLLVYYSVCSMRNEVEFKRIYDNYYQSLSLLCCKYVDVEVAEDIVQDIFMKFWHVTLDFENDKHLMGYLLKAARNACLNHIRLNKTELLQAKHVLNTDQAGEDAFEVEFMESRLYVNIFNAIEQLPERRREIFTMSYLDHMSVEEISLKLGISENTVKTQRLRAKEALRKYLENDYQSLYLLLALVN